MYEIITFDLNLHKSATIDLNKSHMQWVFDEISNNFGINVEAQTGPLSEYAKKTVEEYIHTPHLKRITLLVESMDKIVGMGSIRKLDKTRGEIKRMFVYPEHRKQGIGKALLDQLIKEGRKMELSYILLDTAPFMKVAQEIYKKAGFKLRTEYPETEVPSEFRDLWLYMEKDLKIE